MNTLEGTIVWFIRGIRSISQSIYGAGRCFQPVTNGANEVRRAPARWLVVSTHYYFLTEEMARECGDAVAPYHMHYSVDPASGEVTFLPRGLPVAFWLSRIKKKGDNWRKDIIFFLKSIGKNCFPRFFIIHIYCFVLFSECSIGLICGCWKNFLGGHQTKWQPGTIIF